MRRLRRAGRKLEVLDLRVIGITSGTSLDAVEALLVELELDHDFLSAQLIEHRSVAYPRDLRDALASLLPPATTTVGEICKLDAAVGQAFASVAGELVEAHGPVDLVCSHGQTVFHWVEGRSALGTLQLGEPAWIAERTGATVVSDFRNRDIAAGGQGAPLACLLDVLLLGKNPEQRIGALNLGGIANVTVLGPADDPVAFDTGPANALIDAAMSWVTGGHQSYDHGGAWAASGHADDALVGRLLDEPYFSLPPPKSTGKELFNLEYLTSRLGPEHLAPADLVASVTAATGKSIAAALAPFELAELFVSGGGMRNPTLMAELRQHLPGVSFRTTKELGVPEAAKEALLFAVVGYLSACGLPANVPSCTGASHACVLGSLTPGSRRLRLPTTVRPPSRLVVRDVKGTGRGRWQRRGPD